MAVFRTEPQWVTLFVFLIFLVICPLFLSDRILTIMTMIGIAVISVHGLNILTGYCGQISMGHVGLHGGGRLCIRLFSPPSSAGPSGRLYPAAALAAGVAGLIFGLPSLKIKGFYLIMATIAAHFIIIWSGAPARSFHRGS